MATKRLEMKDLMGKSVKGLVKMRNQLREKLYDLKLKNSLRSLNQTHEITTARKNIARVNTAITKKIAEADTAKAA